MIRKIYNYYKETNALRRNWFSLKWRTIIALLSAVAIILINDYIQAKYNGYGVFTPTGELASFFLADKYMDGFVSGVVFGIIAVSIMLEGEYIRGIRKTLQQIEKDTMRGFSNLTGSKRVLRKSKRKVM